MKCPFCHEPDTSVLESRVAEDGDSLRRRRECIKCGQRFTTYERVEGPVLLIVKKDGRREPFDREKVRLGLLKACEKRPVSVITINQAVDEIEKELMSKENSEVTSRIVGNTVLKKLKKIDKVAWLRFASVYLQFAELGDFEKAIDKTSQ